MFPGAHLFLVILGGPFDLTHVLEQLRCIRNFDVVATVFHLLLVEAEFEPLDVLVWAPWLSSEGNDFLCHRLVEWAKMLLKMLDVISNGYSFHP